MSAPLELRVTRFENDGSWDWRLSDGQGRFLADCEARLAAEPRRLEALRHLPAYLDRRRGAFPVENELADLAEAFTARDSGRFEAALAGLPPERRQEALALLAEASTSRTRP